MQALGEQAVRRLYFQGVKEIRLSADVFITYPARQYAREKGMRIIKEEATSQDKPAHMTHLCAGGELVRKNHPRIRLRGKLDSLLADVIRTQILAQKLDRPSLVEQLQEIADFIRQTIGCEVSGRELPHITLFGLELDEVQARSHHPEERYGRGHTPPHYRDGELYAALNRLRTLARETEISAVDAFCGEIIQRSDILHALNRLSSAFYILMCMEAAGAVSP